MIIAGIVTPFILIVMMICSLLFGTASHNNAAVDYTFNGGIIPLTMPAEYKTYITEMRSCFSSLDSAIAAVESEMEDGDSLLSLNRSYALTVPLMPKSFAMRNPLFSS